MSIIATSFKINVGVFFFYWNLLEAAAASVILNFSGVKVRFFCQGLILLLFRYSFAMQVIFFFCKSNSMAIALIGSLILRGCYSFAMQVFFFVVNIIQWLLL